MWEPGVIRGLHRKIRSISRGVTDPDDIAIILELEQEFARVKADAVRKLKASGYSNRDVARATGRDEKAVRQWLKVYPDADTSIAREQETDDVSMGPED